MNYSIKQRLLCVSIVIAVCMVSCKEKDSNDQTESSTKKINVAFNKNVHTSHIVELLVWEGDYPTRPLVVEMQNRFKKFKNHPAIVLSDSLLMNEIFYFDELTEILLYLEDFPSTRFKHPLENSPYAEKKEIITRWIEELAQFYIDAEVEEFLSSHKSFYEGAKQEVLKNLPNMSFVDLIEDYYEDEKVGYTIIPAPEMPTGGAYGQRGIGPYVHTARGMGIYQVISASLPVKKDSLGGYNDFGFDNKEFILRNSYHEFGHAFVNPVLEKPEYQKLIASYEYLFVPKLQQAMDVQNYNTWFDCLAEHFVRLGEIRLAERSGDKQWAEELRQYHTKELNFVFLPELEAKRLAIEKIAPDKSFSEILPDLLKSIKEIDTLEIKKRIVLSSS